MLTGTLCTVRSTEIWFGFIFHSSLAPKLSNLIGWQICVETIAPSMHVRAWLASLSSMAEVPISIPTRLLPWKCVFNWWPTCLEAMTFTLKAAPCAMTVDSCLLIMDFQPLFFKRWALYTNQNRRRMTKLIYKKENELPFISEWW